MEAHVAKPCPSCGFLNDVELGACLLCRRDLSAPGRARAFGGLFPDNAVPAAAAAALGPAFDVATDASVGETAPPPDPYASAVPMLSTEPMFDLDSSPEPAAHASPTLPPGPSQPPPPTVAARPRSFAPPRLELDAPPFPQPHTSPQPPPPRASSRPPPHATFDPTRDASMAAAALAASGYSVDFTPATLGAVDAYLDRHARGAIDPDAPEARFLITELGAYLGEVVVRAHGGVWSLDAQAPEAVCVTLRDGSRFSPFVWLRRRLEDPRGEPLRAKYARVFLGQAASAPPAAPRPAGSTVPFERPRAEDDASAYLREPKALLAAGRREEALAKLEALVRAQPRDVDALGLLAQALDEASRFEEAQQAWDRALALDASRAPLWMGKGLSLDRRGFADKAIIALHRATQIDPTLVEAWRRMGVGYLRFRRTDDALACFDEVLARTPGDATAHRGRAEALRALGRDDEARAALARSGELGDAEAWFELGVMEQARGEADEATRALARYVAAAPRGKHADDATERLRALRG
jgi:tetratricopeptide (TPR) repeat protein